jgi:hypothetical protein
MEQLTIRNVPPELAQALERESLRLREPLERTVIELLRQALRTRTAEGRRNGLARLAGTWTEEEHQEFEEAVAITEQIDEELWR